MNFNSFYFLHMQKCDGRRFIDCILTPLSKKNKNIKILKSPIAHQGWDYRITDKTYVFTILRDPIERAVSHYAYIISERIKAIKKTNKDLNIFIDKKAFIENFKFNKELHNFYATMFLQDISFDEKKIKKVFDEKDIMLIFENINRVNLLIDIETFKSIDKKKLMKKICEDMNCLYVDPDDEYFQDFTSYTNAASKKLYNELTKEDKLYLRQFLDIDYEIYENKGLFCKF